MNAVIFTDSLCSLLLLSNRIAKTFWVEVSQIQQLMTLINENYLLQIQWVSGHSDIAGNEEADREAKLARELDRSETIRRSYEELVQVVKKEKGGIPIWVGKISTAGANRCIPNAN